MDPTMEVVLVTVAACAATAVLGGVILQAVRSRSLLWSIVVAALVPVLAVSAAVVINVERMFISAHDSTIVSLALGCASVIAVLLSFVLGRRVASGSRELTHALRGLADAPGPDARQPSSAPAPAEITALARELAGTRSRLDASQERERAVERSRRELVAFMSHDLRTPLAGLRALAEGLEDGVIDDTPTALRQMRQTVDRMNALVGDLFELSRLRAEDHEARVPGTMVSLAEISEDAVAELDAHARQRQVDLSLDVADEGDRLAVHGSGDDLTRVLVNLLGNAVRHTAPGGTVRLAVCRALDGRVRLSVSDGCGGIPDTDFERLFDAGWRGDPERGPGDAGAGLGLAIAKGLVERHNGSLTVANVPGGCRFQVELPEQTAAPSHGREPS